MRHRPQLFAIKREPTSASRPISAIEANFASARKQTSQVTVLEVVVAPPTPLPWRQSPVAHSAVRADRALERGGLSPSGANSATAPPERAPCLEGREKALVPMVAWDRRPVVYSLAVFEAVVVEARVKIGKIARLDRSEARYLDCLRQRTGNAVSHLQPAPVLVWVGIDVRSR